MDDKRLDIASAQPTGQPESIPAGLESQNDPSDHSTGFHRMIPPTLHQTQQLETDGGAPMTQVDDLSRSLITFEQNSTSDGDLPSYKRSASLDSSGWSVCAAGSRRVACLDCSTFGDNRRRRNWLASIPCRCYPWWR